MYAASSQQVQTATFHADDELAFDDGCVAYDLLAGEQGIDCKAVLKCGEHVSHMVQLHTAAEPIRAISRANPPKRVTIAAHSWCGCKSVSMIQSEMSVTKARKL